MVLTIGKKLVAERGEEPTPLSLMEMISDKNNNLDKILNKISVQPSVISFSCKQESSVLEINDEEL